MKLEQLTIVNFQSFGPTRTQIDLEDLTFMIGPNGSGKTAVLQSLCRMFAFNQSLRRVRSSDFHVPLDEEESPTERDLAIEVEFTLAECQDDSTEHETIPPCFKHMRLDSDGDVPRIRYRLEASMGQDGDIDEQLLYVLEADDDGNPTKTKRVKRAERNHICVHYLPARRNPSDHIAYNTSALWGRLLRATNWKEEQDQLDESWEEISSDLHENATVDRLEKEVDKVWKKIHTGNFFTDPSICFGSNQINSILSHVSLQFSGHDKMVDYSRLSDGQKSILYLSLVLATHAAEKKLIETEQEAIDITKLRPPVFTVIAMEEPENSLSPHYLGRIVTQLGNFSKQSCGQALIATHAPSMLRRVDPESIRHTRLRPDRCTQVTRIVLPKKATDAYKFIREGIQAFPELYFARLVVLGEGDSEEIVLPRLLAAEGIPVDETGIAVVPLGGRHVNHMWNLLTGLQIPYVTLLDLDLARHQGGWGRVRYVAKKLKKYNPGIAFPSVGTIEEIPKWNNSEHLLLETEANSKYISYMAELETLGIFFSSPLDLDFTMLTAFTEAYNADESDEPPSDARVCSVLGDSHFKVEQYSVGQKSLFDAYHSLFKTSSKPTSHIRALASLSDEDLQASMPYKKMIDFIKGMLEYIPE